MFFTSLVCIKLSQRRPRRKLDDVSSCATTCCHVSEDLSFSQWSTALNIKISGFAFRIFTGFASSSSRSRINLPAREFSQIISRRCVSLLLDESAGVG